MENAYDKYLVASPCCNGGDCAGNIRSCIMHGWEG